ncbi:MAG: hypothetical protein Ct9H300mP32_3690 [Verrucomicrobiota bacterium]|nr:MAG: hypothetical protein Ct9H300mP32_3690 [Verrucomicrobiota bacterium]
MVGEPFEGITRRVYARGAGPSPGDPWRPADRRAGDLQAGHWQAAWPAGHEGELESETAGPQLRNAKPGAGDCPFFRAANPTVLDLGKSAAGQFQTLAPTRPGCWINILPAQGLVLIPEASSGWSAISHCKPRWPSGQGARVKPSSVWQGVQVDARGRLLLRFFFFESPTGGRKGGEPGPRPGSATAGYSKPARHPAKCGISAGRDGSVCGSPWGKAGFALEEAGQFLRALEAHLAGDLADFITCVLESICSRARRTRLISSLGVWPICFRKFLLNPE